jgi:predicted butyrate kinase (DUF1464 family)
MPRVAGADPGTSSLDLLVLHDGAVADQSRFSPEQLRDDAAAPARWLAERGPFNLVAGPSGYGLPLKAARDCDERDLALMSLVRLDDATAGQGAVRLRAVQRALRDAGLPVVFLPGAIHLPTIPAHRKHNRIDLGTADKLCAAALALALQGPPYEERGFCLVELGSAFTACLVIDRGRVVDGAGGTSGPLGWSGAGAWDGEFAYLLHPLTKRDLFAGGRLSAADRSEGLAAFRESLLRTVAGLRAVTPFRRVLLSGRLPEAEPDAAAAVAADLRASGEVACLGSLPGAWVKHAAQGAALLADGLAGGAHVGLVDQLEVCRATGTALDWLRHPRASEVRRLFGLP